MYEPPGWKRTHTRTHTHQRLAAKSGPKSQPAEASTLSILQHLLYSIAALDEFPLGGRPDYTKL